MLDRYKLLADQQVDDHSDRQQVNGPVEVQQATVVANGGAVVLSQPPLNTEPLPPPPIQKQSLLSRIIFGKRRPAKANAQTKTAAMVNELKPLAEGEPLTLGYFLFESRMIWRKLLHDHPVECQMTRQLRNRCIIDFIILCIFFGAGGLMFRFVEGAFENFYKCGVRRVKRDFVDHLWQSSHNLRFDVESIAGSIMIRSNNARPLLLF